MSKVAKQLSGTPTLAFVCEQIQREFSKRKLPAIGLDILLAIGNSWLLECPSSPREITFQWNRQLSTVRRIFTRKANRAFRGWTRDQREMMQDAIVTVIGRHLDKLDLLFHESNIASANEPP